LLYLGWGKGNLRPKATGIIIITILTPAASRIKPLPALPVAFANGHGRYTTGTAKRTIFHWAIAVAYNRYKFMTAPLLSRFRAILLLASETATWILDPEAVYHKIPAGTGTSSF
jgi:hypothetical protein